MGLIQNPFGRMLREIDTRFGSAVGYAYDQASRLTSKVYPDGSVVHYAYDGAGRTVGISDPFGDTTRFVHDAAGRRIQKLGTGGLRTEYGYDPGTGWLTGVTSYTDTNAIASAFAYPFHDDAGNREEMIETNGGSTTYGYDALDRLERLDPPDEPLYPANGAETWFAYDGVGNRTDFGPQSSPGVFVSPHTTYTYASGVKRLLDIQVNGQIVESFTYDVNGNAVSWWPRSEALPRGLGYDALGRMVSVSFGFTASYVYDPFGRRIEKTEEGTTTRYQYDGLDVVAEYDASQLQATYVFGPGIDEVLKLQRGTTVAAYHTDGLGSVVAISEGGTLRNTYRYDAFGNPVEESGSGPLPNAYTYTGRELDASGLYYYRARYYLPSAGRFLTPDPIGLQGGLNAYAYVDSNPVNFTDPFGLMAGTSFGAAWPELPPLFDSDPFEDWVYSSPLFADFGPSQGALAASAAPLIRPTPPLRVIPGGGASPGSGLLGRLLGPAGLAYVMGSFFSHGNEFAAATQAFALQFDRLEENRPFAGLNIDTGAAVNFAAGGPTNPVVAFQNSVAANRQMGITQTAFLEAIGILAKHGGPTEQARFVEFLARTQPLPEIVAPPFQIHPSRPLAANDLRIFGTGAALGIPTLTTDGTFVTTFQNRFGVPLNAIVVPPLTLQGN